MGETKTKAHPVASAVLAEIGGPDWFGGRRVSVNWRVIEDFAASTRVGEEHVFVTFEPSGARPRQVRPGILLTPKKARTLAKALKLLADSLEKSLAKAARLRAKATEAHP
jgi:hypothetical protein